MRTFYSIRPGGIPARNAKGERLLLFLGIIDILQSYRLKKKIEHTMKSLIHDGVSEFISYTQFLLILYFIATFLKVTYLHLKIVILEENKYGKIAEKTM